VHKSWRFGIAVKSIDRISSSIDRNFPDVDRSIIKSIDRIYAELEFQKP
jgi:hypothetical protein